MSELENKVHEVYCENIDFNVFIYEFSEDVLEDKLTYFAQEKGFIPKVFYDDYILASCIANINQILQKLSDDNLSPR